MSISSLVPSRLSARQVLPAIAGIYISQTIITALTTQALPSLLRDAGASLQVAGLTALLWIPWGLRFLWAPAVERWRLPAGQLTRHSRTLVLTGQWLIAAVLLLLGLAALGGVLSLSGHAGWILGGLLLAALVAATTDVASDGFTVEQLASQQRGWGNVAQVGGSYVGAMLGAGGFLLVAGSAGWPWALMAASLAVLLLSIPMLLLREPPRDRALAVGHRPGLMFAVLGFVWVALYSALMGLTSPLQSGVDFTLFQSADALLAVAGGVAGGWLSQHLGYEVCFGLAAASAVVAVLVVRRKAPSLDDKARGLTAYE